MAISLKALYDQVQSINTSGGIKSLNKSSTGHIEFYNGIIINWGITDIGTPPGASTVWKSYKFSKPFSSKCASVCTGDIAGQYTGKNNPVNLRNISTSGFEITIFDSFTAYYIAIGYLITNRIKGWVM